MTMLWEYGCAAEGEEAGGVRINPASAVRLAQYLAAHNRWMELRLCGADEAAIQAAEAALRTLEDAALRGAEADHLTAKGG